MKQIVFDFGNVLLRWDPTVVYDKVFDSEEEFSFFFTKVCSSEWNAKQDAGRSFADATIDLQSKYPKYIREIAMYYDRWQDMILGPIESTVKLLPRLKEKFKLFGLTNWSAESFPFVYEKYPFFKEFDGIVVSGEERLIKPGPEIFEVLLTRYNLLPKESLFIDDNMANIDTAIAMGFETIHYTDGMDLESELLYRGLL